MSQGGERAELLPDPWRDIGRHACAGRHCSWEFTRTMNMSCPEEDSISWHPSLLSLALISLLFPLQCSLSLEGGDTHVPFLNLSTQHSLFPELWLVMSFCIDHRPLHTAVSLVSTQMSTNLWHKQLFFISCNLFIYGGVGPRLRSSGSTASVLTEWTVLLALI